MCLAHQAPAQEMTVVDHLSFGTFAVADNSISQAIVVTPDNDTFPDTGIAVGQPGQRGVYEFTGLPPNVAFYVGVDVPNPPSEGGIVIDDSAFLTNGRSFTVDSFALGNGGVLQSDGAGDATMLLGATLHTSGDGTPYSGGTYAGQVSFTIYY